MTEETTLDTPRLDGRLYSVGQITAATFVGSPLAGCLLLAHNYRVLRRNRAALYSLMCGVVATVIVFVGASWLPESFPNAALPVGYCFPASFSARTRCEYYRPSFRWWQAGRLGCDDWDWSGFSGAGCRTVLWCFDVMVLRRRDITSACSGLG